MSFYMLVLERTCDKRKFQTELSADTLDAAIFGAVARIQPGIGFTRDAYSLVAAWELPANGVAYVDRIEAVSGAVIQFGDTVQLP